MSSSRPVAQSWWSLAHGFQGPFPFIGFLVALEQGLEVGVDALARSEDLEKGVSKRSVAKILGC